MKITPVVFIASILVAGAGAATAATTVVALNPSAMHWVAGTGAAKGTSAAILTGDPTKAGTSIIRVKMPDGYVNKPHYHANPEYITIISGSVLFGTGDTVNKSAAKLYGPGSFIAVPALVHHWSIVQGETVEQIGGNGPLDNLPIKHGM